MDQNRKMLQRLLTQRPSVADLEENKKRKKKLKKLNEIASQHPLKNGCFDRAVRLNSVTSIKKKDFCVLEPLGGMTDSGSV